METEHDKYLYNTLGEVDTLPREEGEVDSSPSQGPEWAPDLWVSEDPQTPETDLAWFA